MMHTLKRSLVMIIGIFLSIMGFLTSGAEEKPKMTPIISTVKKGAQVITIKGVSRSWKDIDKTPLTMQPKPRRMRPVMNFSRTFPNYKTNDIDPVAQRSITGRDAKSRIPLMPAATKSYAGMNLSSNGSGWPPDTNGDVGTNHYIQTVNASICIYNKSDGSQASAPVTFDAFFEGAAVSGTPCDNENNGDPIVLYDRYAQRWFILDFAWAGSETDGSYFSIAVSKTDNPLGEWWLYAMRADNTLMNDYPKCGIWHDGIYITANMFQFSGSYQSVKVWALKKPDIYNGSLVSQTVSDSGVYAWSLLPSNAKSQTAAPASSPNYMFSFFANEWGLPNDVLLMWKYDVDWTTPANTTWTGPASITASAFGLHSSRIPQSGTANTLDVLYSRLLYSAFYRKFGFYESVYLCHDADVGGVCGVRWYEVRINSGTASIYQQGTYVPDSNHRWMGSIGADKYGNIAVGYSVSSSSMFPAIRYAGRLGTDPLNQLSQGEATLISGTGSQTGFVRWGDYSMMSIDPADDETFWFTTEYMAATGNNWQTRIGAFKLSSAMPAPTAAQLNVYHGSNFAGDANADVSLYRPSNGLWCIRGGSYVTWGGQSGDIPAVGDYNGDGVADIAIYRPSTGQWLIRSIGNYSYGGQSGDIPVPGDYNGDGTTEIAIYRPSNGLWSVRGVGNTFYGGQSGDIPVPGDYNGDGTTDYGIYRPSTGQWFIRNIGNYTFGGQNGDIPVPGDYNGDGQMEIAIYRPSNGLWAVRGVGNYYWGGQNGDIPVQANYISATTAIEIAVYRPSTGQWIIRGGSVYTYGGQAGDVPTTRGK